MSLRPLILLLCSKPSDPAPVPELPDLPRSDTPRSGDGVLHLAPEGLRRDGKHASTLVSAAFSAALTVSYDALVYTPGARSGVGSPLVVALHGAGERGTDLAAVARHGLVRRIVDGFRPPFAVVAPQCLPERWWDVEALVALLDSAHVALGTDPAKVAVTGYSMGGYGAFGLATRAPERIAACAPVCGGGHPFFADRLRLVPVRAYHGALDDVVPLRASSEMVDAVNAAGGQATLTVFPDAAHDSWTPAYADDGLYTWLDACWSRR